jgi:hypothetical protein
LFVSRRFGRFEKISRDDAVAVGQPVYWTGKPCRNGHLDFRSVSEGKCRKCAAAAAGKQKIKKIIGTASTSSRREIDKLRDAMELRRIERGEC